MLWPRWDFPFTFQNRPAFVLNSTFTHHEIHGRLSLKTGTLLHGSHRPDICSSHPGGGPAGWDLLPDYEATDWEQKQVLTWVQIPCFCRARAPMQVVSRSPCCTCDGVGAEGKGGQSLEWHLPFPLFPGSAVGSPLPSTRDCWLAVTGHRAGSLPVSPELLLCSHRHSVLASVQHGGRWARYYCSPLAPKAVCGENTAPHRVLACCQWLCCQPSICFKFPSNSISLL